MTKKSKKYLIATETHEIVIVRNGREKTYGFCSKCATEVELLNLDLAVSMSGKGAREIFALVEAGDVHSLEMTNGLLLVCRNSILETKTEGKVI